MNDTVLKEKPDSAMTELPPWWQEMVENAQTRKGDLVSAYGNAAPAPAGIYMSPETRAEFVDPQADPGTQAHAEAVLDRLGQVATEQQQKVILTSPQDIVVPPPYDRLAHDNSDTAGFGLSKPFAEAAGAAGMDTNSIKAPSVTQQVSSVLGAAAALPLDDLNQRAFGMQNPDYLLGADKDVCLVTLPTQDSIAPIIYPNNLAMLDGVNTYSNVAPIYDERADGSLTGTDPKSDMRLYLGRHEIDHCTNMDGQNMYPEYVSDTNAARGYAQDYADGLASDASVPHFIRSLRAENTLLDINGDGDQYILNGIVPLPGEGAPLTNDEQITAAGEIWDMRSDLYANAGITEEMMADPEQLSSNRYALYHESERMLRDGELDDTPYAKQLAENFVEGAERYQPESYQVEPDSVRHEPAVLPPESYGVSATPALPQLPNFQFQGQAATP